MSLRLAIAFGLIAAASPALAGDPPFVGKWNCEVATFTFTATTYQPGEGSDILPIQSVTLEQGNSFTLNFADGYAISLSNVTDTTMGWFSLASGDGFNCTRVK